ncbi:LacI family transcriptional regulator [Prauserella sp. PE36]|uniref:LacI family transcriptional regulator n=1 Tax=Prauserella endophytica TaxID=1592324 RepID=A0ABY2SAM1_9PSEU|nr:MULTISPECIES: LacI family DNA-binding transcriptional regulator [Prauserella]PXY28991.1 LacI family transcriptional regulator [Prauserella coralliicola]RBM14796.1 LacI family transcriptional regulator [Prauserella sp. PE36]TKG72677.1 LacI family transcriptional regulator [Prauserella endophytica]
MGITSRDVARLAGVSQPTVSRALRGDPRVSEETVRKVRMAAEALNYVPSEAGRSLSTRISHRIGVLVTDLANPFYPHLVGPLHDELEQRGYRMMLFTERSEAAASAERLVDRSIDGLVLATSTLDSALPAELGRRELPFVYLNREGTTPADAVAVDNRLGGEQVARQLVEDGHRHIGGIFGPDNTSTGRDRELGFRQALADAGIALRPAHVRHGPFEFETGRDALPELLAADPAPTAVFCGNDVVAIGVLDAARRLGVDVPSQLTVVGFDDIPMASWASFELSTVRHDLRGMARTAAGLLVERVSGAYQGEPRRVVLSPRFVGRRTHGAPSGN